MFHRILRLPSDDVADCVLLLKKCDQVYTVIFILFCIILLYNVIIQKIPEAKVVCEKF